MRKTDRKVSTKGQSATVQHLRPVERRQWATHVQSCLRRDIENKIDPKNFLDLTQRDCFYCGRAPYNTTKWTLREVIQYNGVDRIDNSLPYQDDNVVPCCKECNQMKSDKNPEEFLAACARIAQRMQR